MNCTRLKLGYQQETENTSSGMNGRRLSSLEKHYYYRSKLNVLPCIYLGIQLNKLPGKQLLTTVLRELILEYPQLHCNIFEYEVDREPYIKSIDKSSIYFEDVTEYISWSEDSDANINHIFQAHAFTYGMEKPLWKVLIDSRRSRLILLASHVLFDGMSCVEFWKGFFHRVNQNLDKNEEWNNLLFAVDKTRNDIPKPHPYETWPISLKYKVLRPILSTLFRLYPSFITKPNANLFQFRDYVFPHGLLNENVKDATMPYSLRNDNCQCNFKLSPEKLDVVLKTCRNSKITLTSYLAALFCVSLRESIDPQVYTGTTVKVDIPMNTRKICERALHIDPRECKMGNFVASLSLEHDLKDASDMIEIAKKFQERLNQQSVEDISETINNVKLLEVVNNAAFVEEKLKASCPPGTFEITNLGLQSLVPTTSISTEFEIQDAFFNEPQGFSNIFTCAIISTPVGGLNCSLSYPRDIQSQFKPFISHTTDLLAIAD